jgi:hypothetical protein
MKLMLCRQCGDVVQMRPELRACACGKSRGRYLADQATVEQTEGSLSIALHNHDLRTAVQAFDENPGPWHPLIVFRAYLNPLSENDVQYVPGEPVDTTDDDSPEARTPPEAPPHPEDTPGA